MPAKKTSDNENTTDTVQQDPNNAPDETTPPTDAPAPEQPVDEAPRPDKSVAELANDVLNGQFGDFNVVREKLDKAGVDTAAVLTLVNDRLAHGAPSAYRPNVAHVLDSARRGEWGDKNVGLRVRAAGFSDLDASHVETEYTQGH